MRRSFSVVSRKRSKVDADQPMTDRLDWREEFMRLSASPSFDVDWYIRRYMDVSASGLSPLEHYIKYGRLFGRLPGPPKPLSVSPITAASISKSPDNASLSAEYPKVSVVCITYNQESYIEQAIEGMLMQELDCKCEIIIADDCSSDRTADIVEYYAQSDPRIVPIFRKINIGSADNFGATLSLCRGQYVAICEGDDYWTDPAKLQLQVNFLDDNPEYSLCFHPVEVAYETKAERTIFPDRNAGFSVSDLVRANFIQTNSVMYRWRYRDNFLSHYNPNLVPADWHLHLMHVEVGRIGFIDRVMGVYRKHSGGIWSNAGTLAHRLKYGHSEMAFYRDLKSHFGGIYNSYFDACETAILNELIEYSLLSEDYVRLRSLVLSNKTSAERCLQEFGVELASLDLSDSLSLEKTLKAQNKISVVVLAYNHADTINQCLESVLAQRGPFELEVVIGDDGSSDGSAELLARRKAEHPHDIKLTGGAQNVGMLANLKRTLQECTGNYVAFCEADDYWLSPSKLSKQFVCLSKSRDMSMCFNWVLLEEMDGGAIYPHPQQSRIGRSAICFSDIAREPLSATFSCCFYRASAVKQVPDEYFHTAGAADWLFNLYVARHGQIGFIKETLSVYRIHSRGQWSGLNAAKKEQRFEEARRRALNIFGSGRGLDSSVPRIQVRSLHSLRGTFVSAYLDDPKDDVEAYLDDGIQVRGWLLHLRGKALRLVVLNSRQKPRYFSLNENRPDVLSHFRHQSGMEYIDPCVGFDIFLRRLDSGGVKLGIELPDRVIWWKKIEVVIEA